MYAALSDAEPALEYVPRVLGGERSVSFTCCTSTKVLALLVLKYFRLQDLYWSMYRERLTTTAASAFSEGK